MPQKITRRSGARTSGTAELGGFGLGERFGVTRIESFLETPPQNLPFEQDTVARAAWRKADDPYGLVPAAVAPRVTLGFAERTQPSHGSRLGAGSDDPAAGTNKGLT